jgi:hypothetical protein
MLASCDLEVVITNKSMDRGLHGIFLSGVNECLLSVSIKPDGSGYLHRNVVGRI